MKASRNYPFDSKILETLFVDPKEISYISPLSGGYFNPKLLEYPKDLRSNIEDHKKSNELTLNQSAFQ